MTKKRLNNSGFTLMEIMVAVSIIAIVFVSVFRMHTQTISMTTAVRFDTTAPLLAREKLSEMETTSLESVSGESGDFGDTFPGYRWQLLTEDVSSEVLGETADLRKIEIIISLDNDRQTFRLRTYRLITES
jgi:type II secretion system protein I